MHLIYGQRNSGKTTELIKIASEGVYKLIVCVSENEARRIFQQSKVMGLEIPFPITFSEFIRKDYAGEHIESFLIDDVDLFFQHMSTVPIEAVSITSSIKILSRPNCEDLDTKGGHI